jgi:hypothetical protein
MWDELGIAPCDDAKAIRRAYAARLKKLDPDRDPEGFARLRSAFERALDGATRNGSRPSSDASPPTSAQSDADPAADELRAAPRSEAEPDRGETAAAHSTAPTEKVRKAALPSPPASDYDDIRDRALLIALDAALRRRDAAEATALYYRAAATGALSLERAPDVIERLLAVAVDDRTLGAAAFRHLTRTVGLATPQSRAPVASELRQRVLARLRADDWYDDLLAKAGQKKDRTARRQRKIARLILRRIGRHWHPRVDKAALRTWLDQCKTHAVWLEDRIDPLWVNKLDRRLRRRELFGLACYTLFIGAMLIQFVHLSIVAIIDGIGPLWPLVIGPFLAAFFLWILKLLVTELLKRTIPGWAESAGIALLRRTGALWAGRLRASWRGWRTKRPADGG